MPSQTITANPSHLVGIVQALEALVIKSQIARGAYTPPEPKERAPKPEGKKMGVWVDGKLKYQSRDSASIYHYADKKMADRRVGMVWVAPVGSFITA